MLKKKKSGDSDVISEGSCPTESPHSLDGVYIKNLDAIHGKKCLLTFDLKELEFDNTDHLHWNLNKVSVIIKDEIIPPIPSPRFNNIKLNPKIFERSASGVTRVKITICAGQIH